MILSIRFVKILFRNFSLFSDFLAVCKKAVRDINKYSYKEIIRNLLLQFLHLSIFETFDNFFYNSRVVFFNELPHFFGAANIYFLNCNYWFFTERHMIRDRLNYTMSIIFLERKILILSESSATTKLNVIQRIRTTKSETWKWNVNRMRGKFKL